MKVSTDHLRRDAHPSHQLSAKYPLLLIIIGLAPEIRSPSDERFPEHMIGVLLI